MLDPYWLGGKAGHTKRTSLHWFFILRNDTLSPAVVKLEKGEALRILEAGESAGMKRNLSPSKLQPFYNPHLLFATEGHLELQRNFYGRLLDLTSCYLFNSGVADAGQLKQIVLGEG